MLDFSKEKTPGIARVPTSPSEGDLTPPDVKVLGRAAVDPPRLTRAQPNRLRG